MAQRPLAKQNSANLEGLPSMEARAAFRRDPEREKLGRRAGRGRSRLDSLLPVKAQRTTTGSPVARSPQPSAHLPPLSLHPSHSYPSPQHPALHSLPLRLSVLLLDPLHPAVRPSMGRPDRHHGQDVDGFQNKIRKIWNLRSSNNSL